MSSDPKPSSPPLAIVGVYPPPFSGVSVSLQRLLPYLDEAGLDYVVYNTGPSRTDHPRIRDVGWSLRWTYSALLRMRHRVMQFSTSRWWVRVFAALVNRLRGTKVIIYARGYSLPDSYFAGNALKRWLVRRSLRRAARVFAPNPHLRERIAEIGYPQERIHVIAPFIPPKHPASADDVADDVRAFCDAHGPIISANGAYTLIDGKDVYGLVSMAQLLEDLLLQFPNLGLLVYLRAGAHRDFDAFQDLRNRLARPPFSDHAMFHESEGEFYPALSLTDLFFRPTTTDGDANSIREALHFGVPALASDVVPRPEGCRLYRGGDQADLTRQAAALLGDLPIARAEAAAAPTQNAAELLIPVYRELLGEQAPRPAIA